MRANAGKSKDERDAAAFEIFKQTQTKVFVKVEDAKIAFEKAKRIGAQAELADILKDCKTAGKNKDESNGDAETAFAEPLGLTKADNVDFKTEFEQFKKEAAGNAAVKAASACKADAGNNEFKLAKCHALAKAEAAKTLGEDKDYDKMNAKEKAKFDAKFERLAKEASAKELAEAMRANAGKSKDERDAAAFEIFKQTQTKVFTKEEDIKMAFEKAKRIGAQAELADILKDCKTAGKNKDECNGDAETAFAESLGLTKADNVAFKAASACKADAGNNEFKLAKCHALAKAEAAKTLGEDKDYDKMNAKEKAKFDAKF